MGSCDTDTKVVTKEQKEPVVQLNYTSGTGCVAPAEKKGCMRLEIQMPSLQMPTGEVGISDSIRAFALRHPLTGEVMEEKDLQKAVDSLYQLALEENPHNDVQWFVEREINTISRSNKAVCIAFSESSYMGGAHPNRFTIYKLYHPATGRRLALSHLFDAEILKRLRQIAEQKFRKQQGMTDTSTYSFNGFWFTGNRFELTDNAAITDSGLVFLYNPYDIAPYSTGAIQLEVTFAELNTKNPI
jgi:hypothetical protein